MRLSVDLYNNLSDQMYQAQVGKLNNKQLSVIGDYSEYLNQMPSTIFEETHLHNLTNASVDRRVYRDTLGILCDSSLDLEVIGVTKYAKNDTVLFTLQDSLDLVLNYLCDVDMNVLRQLPNYQQISRGILNADHRLLDGIPFGDLLGLDSRLDAYLIRINTTSISYEDFLNKFFIEVTSACNTLLHQYVMQYRSYYSDLGLKLPLRSKNICSIVFGSEIEIDDKMELVPGYFIQIKSYKKCEYMKYVNELRSEYVGKEVE